MKKDYYRDVDRENTIVVKTQGRMRLDVFTKGDTDWRETQLDSAYEREVYFGEGNCCLFSLKEEEALRLLEEWKAPMGE